MTTIHDLRFTIYNLPVALFTIDRMPEPKISRRCPTCGASIRAQAFFCPQCGGKLAPPAATPTTEESAHIHDTVEEAVDPNQTMTEADFRARMAPQVAPDPKPAPEVAKKSAAAR